MALELQFGYYYDNPDYPDSSLRVVPVGSYIISAQEECLGQTHYRFCCFACRLDLDRSFMAGSDIIIYLKPKEDDYFLNRVSLVGAGNFPSFKNAQGVLW